MFSTVLTAIKGRNTSLQWNCVVRRFYLSPSVTAIKSKNKKRSILFRTMAFPHTKSAVINVSNFNGYPLDAFCIPEQCKSDLESVLIPGGLLRDRIERLAEDIANDYVNEPFTAICVLRGGFELFYILLDKIRQIYRISKRGDCDYLTKHIRIEFVRLKSYQNDKSTELEMSGIKNLDSIRGKNVLVVEDIIDTGKSMNKFFEVLADYSPKSSRLVCLAAKEAKTLLNFEPHYIGFIIPDRFIVGCNFEYNDYYRDIQHVCVISEEGKRKYAI